VLAATSVDINLIEAKPTSPLPNVANCPEKENHGDGEPLLEELFRILRLNGSVALFRKEMISL